MIMINQNPSLDLGLETSPSESHGCFGKEQTDQNQGLLGRSGCC